MAKTVSAVCLRRIDDRTEVKYSRSPEHAKFCKRIDDGVRDSRQFSEKERRKFGGSSFPWEIEEK
jgi:hypothetical protein